MCLLDDQHEPGDVLRREKRPATLSPSSLSMLRHYSNTARARLGDVVAGVADDVVRQAFVLLLVEHLETIVPARPKSSPSTCDVYAERNASPVSPHADAVSPASAASSAPQQVAAHAYGLTFAGTIPVSTAHIRHRTDIPASHGRWRLPGCQCQLSDPGNTVAARKSMSIVWWIRSWRRATASTRFSQRQGGGHRGGIAKRGNAAEIRCA